MRSLLEPHSCPYSVPGTGFQVYVSLKEANLAPLYQEVDHSASNDNKAYQGEVDIEKLCAWPVPEKYRIGLTLHPVSAPNVSSHVLFVFFVVKM